MELTRKPRRRRPDGGFTLLEVLIALLVGIIGLLGTVAVQQTVLTATQNANDAAVAMRLAIQEMEQYNVRRLNGPTEDDFAAVALGTWTDPVYLDANGQPGPMTDGNFRWNRQVRVVNLGVGLPYNVSVQVTYGVNTGTPRTARLDMEKRKSW
jgi:type II secretory pathway pseudopilin PulG